MKNLKNWLIAFVCLALVVCVGIIVYNYTKPKDTIQITDTSKVVTIIKGENGDYVDSQDKEEFDKGQEIEPVFLSLSPDRDYSCSISFFNNNKYEIQFGGYLNSSLSSGDIVALCGDYITGATHTCLFAEGKDFQATETYVNEKMQYIYTSNDNGLFRLSFEENFISACYKILTYIREFAMSSNYEINCVYTIDLDLSSFCKLEIFNNELKVFEEILNSPLIKVAFSKESKDVDFNGGVNYYFYKEFEEIPASTVAPVEE